MTGRRGATARFISAGKWLPFSSVLLVCACATPKSYIVLLDSPDSDHPSVVTVTNRQGTRTLDTAGEYVGLSERHDVAPRNASPAMIERDFAAALAAEPDKPRRFLLYFVTGSVALTDTSAELIPEILAEVRARGVPEVAIVGHTDTQGSEASNAELASRRARVVRHMVIDAGVAPDLIAVTSQGEDSPLVATADNVDEPKNRRVEVVIR